MARIYDKAGNKMGLHAICAELVEITTPDQKEILANAIAKYEFDNSQMKLAHGILDSYRLIESTSEQGQRVRKLMNNIMIKYQKSTPANSDDQMIYRNCINDLSR